MSRIDVSRVADNPRFHTEDPLIIERAGGEGAYEDGIWKVDDSAFYSASVSVQPASTEALRNLPEGERIGEILEITGSILFKTTRPELKQVADYIRGYRGRDWKVISADYWAEYGYYGALMVRIKDREPIPEGTVINELV